MEAKIKKYCKFLLVLFIILNFVDCVTTKENISNGGTELNGITAVLISLIGLKWALLFKLIFGVGMSFWIWKMINKMESRKDIKYSMIALGVLDMLYIFIIFCNTTIGWKWLG